MSRAYEFIIFDADAEQIGQQTIMFDETDQAKRKAGSLAKKHGGPVDLAFSQPGVEWYERYITTASPSEFHSAGYRLESLS